MGDYCVSERWYTDSAGIPVHGPAVKKWEVGLKSTVWAVGLRVIDDDYVYQHPVRFLRRGFRFVPEGDGRGEDVRIVRRGADHTRDMLGAKVREGDTVIIPGVSSEPSGWKGTIGTDEKVPHYCIGVEPVIAEVTEVWTSRGDDRGYVVADGRVLPADVIVRTDSAETIPAKGDIAVVGGTGEYFWAPDYCTGRVIEVNSDTVKVACDGKTVRVPIKQAVPVHTEYV